MRSGFLPEQPGKILRQLSDIGSIHLNIGVQMVIVIQTLQDPVGIGPGQHPDAEAHTAEQNGRCRNDAD